MRRTPRFILMACLLVHATLGKPTIINHVVYEQLAKQAHA
jgi:hypothetical protein